MARGSRRRTRSSTLGDAVRRLSPGPRPTPEGVHDLHRALRVARLAHSAAGSGRPRAVPYPPPLRALERSLGALRDLDLFRSVLDSAAPKRPTAAEQAWREEVLRRARIDEAKAEETLRSLATRCLRSPPTMRRLAPGRRSEVRASEAAPSVGRRRLRDALRRARRRLSPGRAHAVRKELRRTLIGPHSNGRAVGVRTAERIRRLVAELGRLHDLDVAIDRIARCPGPGRSRWRDRLVRERRTTGRSVRRGLGSASVAELLA